MPPAKKTPTNPPNTGSNKSTMPHDTGSIKSATSKSSVFDNASPHSPPKDDKASDAASITTYGTFQQDLSSAVQQGTQNKGKAKMKVSPGSCNPWKIVGLFRNNGLVVDLIKAAQTDELFKWYDAFFNDTHEMPLAVGKKEWRIITKDLKGKDLDNVCAMEEAYLELAAVTGLVTSIKVFMQKFHGAREKLYLDCAANKTKRDQLLQGKGESEKEYKARLAELYFTYFRHFGYVDPAPEQQT